MASGGARSTAWKKGESPVKKKGTKNKKTLVKEAIGVKNWNDLQNYVEGEGVVKMIEEMVKMKEGWYVSAFLSLCEFIKPKLQRTTLVGEKESPLIWKEEKTYEVKP